MSKYLKTGLIITLLCNLATVAVFYLESYGASDSELFISNRYFVVMLTSTLVALAAGLPFSITGLKESVKSKNSDHFFLAVSGIVLSFTPFFVPLILS